MAAILILSVAALVFGRVGRNGNEIHGTGGEKALAHQHAHDARRRRESHLVERAFALPRLGQPFSDGADNVRAWSAVQ
ncbi:hypothetical protein ACVINI_000939 [Rhizobium beringeri]